MSSTTAPQRHKIHTERCQAALATITEALPGFLGASSDATWGDVTSAHDLAEALERIADQVARRGEYAVGG
jgi:hypothetical protein